MNVLQEVFLSVYGLFTLKFNKSLGQILKIDMRQKAYWKKEKTYRPDKGISYIPPGSFLSRWDRQR